MFKITIRCVKCGYCASECPSKAIEEKDKQYEINYYKCANCGNCKDICPNVAIDKFD